MSLVTSYPISLHSPFSASTRCHQQQDILESDHLLPREGRSGAQGRHYPGVRRVLLPESADGGRRVRQDVEVRGVLGLDTPTGADSGGTEECGCGKQLMSENYMHTRIDVLDGCKMGIFRNK